MPNVLRFLSCAGILYFGFMFCGWIAIGPYHPKVRCEYMQAIFLRLVVGIVVYGSFEKGFVKNAYIRYAYPAH